MNLSNIEQKVTQGNWYSSAQSQSANYLLKCVTPMIFSQKAYQSRALEIAEEYERAIDANSLEKINDVMNKVLE